MKRSVLIIGVALLAADLTHAADCPATKYFPNPSDIDTHVFQLEAGYTPIAVGQLAAVTPKCSTADTKGYGATIKAAFMKAPDGLKTELCNLKCIAVFDGDGSWGKWANTNSKYKGDDSAVIGVGTNDLNISLKSKLDQNLLGIAGDQHIVNNDTMEVSLMYTLAHEMAHIKWRRDFTNGNINGNCPMDTFITTSWKGHAGSKTRRWTYFGDEFGDYKKNIKTPSQVGSDTDVNAIYNGGFATALGATNPEEDFVESYAIGAIIAANQQYKLNISTILKLAGGSLIYVDDPNFRANSGDLLKFKISQCVFPLLQAAVTGDGDYGKKRDDGRKRSKRRR